MHILDVVENSIDAGAQNVEIQIREDTKQDLLKIQITDDGKGMDESTLEKVLDPFFTTKTVRKVGLGLSLLREAARMANGELSVRSKMGRGTTVTATFLPSHIDCKPLGDLTKTMMTLIISHPEIRFKYTHRKNGQKGVLDTQQLRPEGDLLSLSVVELINLIKKNFPKLR